MTWNSNLAVVLTALLIPGAIVGDAEFFGATNAEERIISYTLSILDWPEQLLNFPANLTESAGGNAVDISIRYPDSGNSPLQKTWCSNVTFDYSDQREQLIVDSYDRYSVSIRGDWQFSSAAILATVYSEPDTSCSCGLHFCCSSNCSPTSATYGSDGPDAVPPASEGQQTSDCVSSRRCISHEVKCNSLPNCALPQGNDAYQDETNSICFPTSTQSPVVSAATVEIMTYIIIGVAVLFGLGFVISFFGVFLYHRQRDWGLRPETVEPRQSIVSAHSNVGTSELTPAEIAAVNIQKIGQTKKVLDFQYA